MAATFFAVAVFVALAAVLVRWTEADYRESGRLTTRSTIVGWLLYLFHADSVAAAAYADALRIEAVPARAALVFGVGIGVVGLVFFVGAASRLARGSAAAPDLQTGGVFALMRHPQNFGWGLMLLGIAVGARSLLALALVALFAVFVTRYADVEEAYLESTFGERWRAYRDRTPSIPGVGGRLR